MPTASDHLFASIKKHVDAARKRQNPLRGYLAEIEALAKAAKLEQQFGGPIDIDVAVSGPKHKIVEEVQKVIEAGLENLVCNAFKPKKLPTWEECNKACEQGDEPALHRFIYENEPAGQDDYKYFRRNLAQVLTEAGQPYLP